MTWLGMQILVQKQFGGCVLCQDFNGQLDENRFASILTRLESSNRRSKLTAEDAIVQLAEKCHSKHAIIAARAGQVAVGVVGRLVGKSHKGFLLAVGARLSDEEPEVREAAITALVRSGENKKQLFADAIMPAVSDNIAWVRRAALKGIGQVGMKGNRRALDMMIARLMDEDSVVRCCAVRIRNGRRARNT